MRDLQWSEPKITKTGKAVMSAIPTKAFWKLWRTSKIVLQEKGISIIKNDYTNNEWQVNKWIDLEDYYKLTTDKQITKLVVDDEKGLLEYQVPHVGNLVNSIKINNWVLDGSDTGTGKTFAALASARELKLKPFVICPKPVIATWWRVAEFMGIELLDVLNYERLKTWKTSYLTKSQYGDIDWRLDHQRELLIFDEAHRMIGRDTINSQLLIRAKEQMFKGMLLSATIADNPLGLKSIGYALGLFPSLKDFWNWTQNYGCQPGEYGGFEFLGDPEDMLKLHSAIYQCNRGSRMAIKNLKNFPDNQVVAEAFTMDSAKTIQKIYDSLSEALARLEEKRKQDKMIVDENTGEESEHPLTLQLRARQEIELLKVPTIALLAKDFMAEGNSVAIFVNFEDSIQELMKILKTNCVVKGGQKEINRQKNIDDFQSNKEHLILCNIRAGGVGISLHDLHGRSRMSLISPTFSARDLLQALGRIHRAGAQSPARQRVIFAADTIEEAICETINAKVHNMNALNDGHLSAPLLAVGGSASSSNSL